MKVRDAMTTEPIWCRGTDSLHDASRVMWEHDCGFVPVVDGERRVVGAITDRDALMASYTQGQSLTSLPVSLAMSTDPTTCGPDDSLEQAGALMREHQIRRLPVVDEESQLQGVIALSDLATKGMPRLEVAETVAAVSTPRPPQSEKRAAE